MCIECVCVCVCVRLEDILEQVWRIQNFVGPTSLDNCNVFEWDASYKTTHEMHDGNEYILWYFRLMSKARNFYINHRIITNYKFFFKKN